MAGCLRCFDSAHFTLFFIFLDRLDEIYFCPYRDIPRRKWGALPPNMVPKKRKIFRRKDLTEPMREDIILVCYS